MKSLFLAAFIVLSLGSCKAQNNPTSAEVEKILKFTNDNYNMGKIITGKATEFTVDIENISASPITLDNVMVGCGCTTPKYTKGPVIAPGTHASVVLGFNGSAVGSFTKNATLFFNGKLTKQVTFYGEGVQQ